MGAAEMVAVGRVVVKEVLGVMEVGEMAAAATEVVEMALG